MVRLLLVVLASVVVCRAIEVPLCDRSYCSCSLPNGLIGDAVKVDDGSAVGCLCACGRDEGELCSTDDHCAQGTSCAYPRDLSQSGTDLVCTNKCALTKCDQYQRCSLDDNKQPICRSRSFDCDPSVVATVVAVRGNEKQTFPNNSVESRYCQNVTPVPPDLSTLIPCRPDMSTRLCPADVKNFSLRNYYNMAKGGVYSRYTEGDWDTSNKTYFFMADKERSAAERLRADSWQLVVGAEDRTRNRQVNNTKKLGDRTHDISFWKAELLAEISRMETEQVNLQEHRRVIEKALVDTQTPLDISEESLLQREKRTGIDQVHDEVERLLSKEVLTIKKCQALMRKMIERIIIQQNLNRTALHLCDQDVQDKHHAQGLDDRAHQLRNSSYGLGLQHGIETVDNTISDMETWLRSTRDNIERCQKERECSERIRGKAESYMRACSNEMCSVFNGVNVALAAKIHETTTLKNKLQEHLLKINNEIRDMDRNIALLRKSLVEKERALKVAHTRLNQLNLRRNMELCHDTPMKGLVCEVGEIRHTIMLLKDNLQEAECSMCRLLKTRSILQNQIAVKENSLQVDSRCLVGRRRYMAMDPDIGPLFNLNPCNLRC